MSRENKKTEENDKKEDGLEAVLDKLKTCDELVKEVTRDLPCQLGSLVRIVCQYLASWGIETQNLDSKDKKVLDKLSHEEYRYEWDGIDTCVYQAIDGAIMDSNLGEGNQQLNTEIARFAIEVILSKLEDNERIIMADIGAGTGNTTGSVLEEVKNRNAELLKKIAVYLIEPCDSSHLKIKDLMRTYPGVEYQRVIAMDYNHFELLREQTFDLVISNAVFHHHSFPFYLKGVYDATKKDGFLIIGDWYTEIWHHPYNVAYLLKEAFGLKQDRVDDFLWIFRERDNWKDANDYWLTREEEEKRRNEGMLLYARNLANRLRGKEKEYVPLRLFEAHEKYEERLSKLNETGFVTDKNEIKKAFKRLKNTEKEIIAPKFAMVTVAYKK